MTSKSASNKAIICSLTHLGRKVGACPKVSYTDIWANLTTIAGKYDAVVVGKIITVNFTVVLIIQL